MVLRGKNWIPRLRDSDAWRRYAQPIFALAHLYSGLPPAIRARMRPRYRQGIRTRNNRFMSQPTSDRSQHSAKPIAIYYEHPDWFRPLFQQLDAKGVHWEKIEAREHSYRAGVLEEEYALVLNRMS